MIGTGGVCVVTWHVPLMTFVEEKKKGHTGVLLTLSPSLFSVSDVSVCSLSLDLFSVKKYCRRNPLSFASPAIHNPELLLLAQAMFRPFWLFSSFLLSGF